MRTIMLMMTGWLLCMAASAQKETRIYQFDKPLYGAAYYAEYTPTNRLDEDRLLHHAGRAGRPVDQLLMRLHAYCQPQP